MKKLSFLLLCLFATSSFSQTYNRNTQMAITPAQRAGDIVTIVSNLISNSQNQVYLYTLHGQTITNINTISSSSNNTILTISFIDNTLPNQYIFTEDVIGFSYTNTQ